MDSTVIVLGVVCLLLLAHSVHQQMVHKKVEKDLLDRLMSKNYQEYAAVRHADEAAKLGDVGEGRREEDFLQVG